MNTSPTAPRAAVIGWPVSHSLSPRLHGFWLNHYNIPGTYGILPIKPEDLAHSVGDLFHQNYVGFNVTVPHKQSICDLLDERDESARKIGAVNLVIIDREGRLHGRNTDAYGFAQNLLTGGFKPAGGKAVVIGAGGAARAVIVALIDLGFDNITLTNRTAAHADELAQTFTSPACKIITAPWRDAARALADAQLLVNTTSLGMVGQPALTLPLDQLPTDATVTDIVYAPLETGLLREARERGHKTIDGLGMLLHQARPAFAAFFGHQPEVTPELRAYVLSQVKA